MKKRILVIPSWYPSIKEPGKGIFFLEQNRILQEICDIKVLTAHKKSNIGRLKKFVNACLFLIFNKVFASRIPGYFLNPPDVCGFEYEAGPNMFKDLNQKMLLTAYKKIFFSEYSGWKPDIVHALDTVPAGLIASHLKSITGIPYLITQHNLLNYFDCKSECILKAIIDANKFICVSEYLARNAILLSGRVEIEVSGNVVDESLFISKAEGSASVFRIIFIGRDSLEKDFDTLIKTIAHFDKICEDKFYCFTIIGDLEKKKSEFLSISGKIKGELALIDFAERHQLAGIIQNSDVLLSTSISETFGMAICEAMMCGIPVVSTNNGGFDEFYLPGINGIRTKIGDYRSLAEAIYSIWKRDIVFNRSEIRESVQHKFGKEAFRSRMSKIYNSLNG